jgi:hypothetical protein
VRNLCDAVPYPSIWLVAYPQATSATQFGLFARLPSMSVQVIERMDGSIRRRWRPLSEQCRLPTRAPGPSGANQWDTGPL